MNNTSPKSVKSIMESSYKEASVRLIQGSEHLLKLSGVDCRHLIGQLMYTQILTPDEDMPTCAVDGKRFLYNPSFILDTWKEDPRLVTFVIAHEMVHLLLKHPFRMKGKDINLCNKAFDYKVNGMVKRMGFDMPPDEWGIFLNEKYDLLDEEQIYNILERLENEEDEEDDTRSMSMPSNSSSDDGDSNSNNNKGEQEGGVQDESTKPQEEEGKKDDESDADSNSSSSSSSNVPDDFKDDGGCGGVIPPPITGDVAKDNELLEEIEDNINAITSMSNSYGDLPKGMIQDVFKLSNKEELPLSDLLIKWASNTIKSGDPCYRRQHRNYVDSDIIMPIHESKDLSVAAFAIDTSGSTKRYLPDFKKVVESFRDHFNCRTYIIYCDVKAHTDVYEEGDDIEFKPVGGGGTRFAPVFDEIENNHDLDDPDVMVFLTDMQCDKRSKKPDYPVLWVDCCYHGSPPPNYTPLFGDIIPFD